MKVITFNSGRRHSEMICNCSGSVCIIHTSFDSVLKHLVLMYLEINRNRFYINPIKINQYLLSWYDSEFGIQRCRRKTIYLNIIKDYLT